MTEDVLGKAEEFLRRRRAQLAGGEGDDIPVLTEVVAGSADIIAAIADSRRDLGGEIARELEAWLDENLPQAIVHAMDGITDKLIQQVHDSAREDLLPRLRQAMGEDTANGEE